MMMKTKQRDQTRIGPRPARPRNAPYRVAWMHPETGIVQVGRMTFTTCQAAVDFARAMDALWPEVSHWVVGHRPTSNAERSATAPMPALCVAER